MDIKGLSKGFSVSKVRYCLQADQKSHEITPCVMRLGAV